MNVDHNHIGDGCVDRPTASKNIESILELEDEDDNKLGPLRRVSHRI